MPSRSAYADLVRYFVAGFVAHRSPLGAHADYPGMGSYNGQAMDRLEGFTRLAPLAAAWLYGRRPRMLTLPGGTSVDILELLETGITTGCDPMSGEYWGDIPHWGQSIVEAADVALTLWLTKSSLWDALPDVRRANVARWLNQVNGKRIPDNNWHLFIVQVNAVLAALNMPHDAEAMRNHYLRVKSFYAGQGWFRDGARQDRPPFDFYNAWGFHYHLAWIRKIAPEVDAEFLDSALAEFVSGYKYFVGPEGFPVMGRSPCYRMAAPSPLIFAQAQRPDLISPGQARRALDATWQYFVQRGALAGGNVTQGYFGRDARLLENYSGAASCLWSLRSLVAAFALPDDHAFWASPPLPLPVEQDDYAVAVPPTGWIVSGNRSTAAITLTTQSHDMPVLEPAGALHLVGDWLCKPRRPANTAAKYTRMRYDSLTPYGIDSSPDDRLPPRSP
jgi:hypothetical protein